MTDYTVTFMKSGALHALSDTYLVVPFVYMTKHRLRIKRMCIMFLLCFDKSNKQFNAKLDGSLFISNQVI